MGGASVGVNQSRLDINGSADLDGSLRVILSPGYSPNPSDVFVILTNKPAQMGTFKCLSGIYLLGENKHLNVQYSPAGVALLTVAAPDPDRVPLSIHAEQGGFLVCWPEEFTGWLLQHTLTLSPPDWHPQPLTDTSRLYGPATNAESYYRLSKP